MYAVELNANIWSVCVWSMEVQVFEVRRAEELHQNPTLSASPQSKTELFYSDSTLSGLIYCVNTITFASISGQGRELRGLISEHDIVR